jgi:hypothetical protein
MVEKKELAQVIAKVSVSETGDFGFESDCGHDHASSFNTCNGKFIETHLRIVQLLVS